MDQMEQMGIALHDLCQPLTTLQGRLELARLAGTPEAYREAVNRGMAECKRLIAVVDRMRKILVGVGEQTGTHGGLQ